MKPQRLKVDAIYHIVEKYVIMDEVLPLPLHTPASRIVRGGEYVIQCLLTLNGSQWRKRPVIVASSREEARFRSVECCYDYHLDWGVVVKLKLLQPKDLPIFINWPFRSILFEELLKGRCGSDIEGGENG